MRLSSVVIGCLRVKGFSSGNPSWRNISCRTNWFGKVFSRVPQEKPHINIKRREVIQSGAQDSHEGLHRRFCRVSTRCLAYFRPTTLSSMGDWRQASFRWHAMF